MEQMLRNFNMFNDLNDKDIAKIKAIAQVKTLKKSEYLFHQNDLRESFYLLVDGQVDIVKSANDNLKPIIRIEAGSFLSENALLDNSPHGSSALCFTDIKIIEIEKEKLKKLLSENKRLAARVFPVISKSLALRLKKMNSRVSMNETRTFTGKTRTEKDLMGTLNIPDDIYYGIQTYRAKENFNVTSIKLSQFPNFVRSLAFVKKACAQANHKLGYLDDQIAMAIQEACEEIIGGELTEEFVVDMIQGGAGTSTNMNANEVIANRASEILGHKKGDYFVHPNNHVNLSQSTNDAYPVVHRLK